MIPYVRLAYASTATANPAHIRNDLLQILDSATRYNSNHQLTGVLLYGNGYFFQCIEGQKHQVDDLYQHLLKDSRHQDITLLSYESREQLRFDQWGLRYVHFEAPVEHFFSQNHLAVFNPYLLNTTLIHPFLDTLYNDARNHPGQPNQALMALEASQSGYVMSGWDMGMVAAWILLALLPLYLIVTLVPGTSGFFMF